MSVSRTLADGARASVKKSGLCANDRWTSFRGGHFVRGNSREEPMENAGVQKQQTPGTSSIAGPMWDPFWFMRAMFAWGRPADAPSFDVEETDDSYVYKVNVKLTLPEKADAAHVKAELKDGELTLLVPKAAAGTPEPEPEPEPESISPPAETHRPSGNGRRGSAKHGSRRAAGPRARRR